MKVRAAILTIILTLLLTAPVAGAVTSGDYEYMINPSGGVTITKYAGTEAELTIPDELGGHPVTAIKLCAFFGSRTLKSVIIPDSVADIETFAFLYCEALERVSIGAGVNTIGENPFYWCGALKTIEVSPGNESLAVIDRALFFVPDARLVTYPGGHAAAEYTIPDFTETIGAYAFVGCSSLTSVTVPDSVKEIESSAFFYCDGLQYVELGRGVERFGVNPFAACESLDSIRIAPDHDTLELMDGMLISKPDMRLITPRLTGRNDVRCEVPEGIKIIGAGAFMGCGKLAEVSLPESVTEIGSRAFAQCAGLRSVNIPENVTLIKYEAFADCSSLTTLTLPETLSRIGMDAFTGCDSLTLTVSPNSFAAGHAASVGIPHVYIGPDGDEGE